jgi:hypothetical protein
VEPDRFDDVGYEIVEMPDTPGRRRISRRGAAALAGAVLAAGALSAGAALALTPSSSPAPPASQPPVPAHFAAETYPARGLHFRALHGGNCLHLRDHTGSAPKL